MFAGMNALYVYALLDPIDGIIKYIGITDAPTKRLNAHLCRARNINKISRKDMWIRSVVERGRSPILVVIDVVEKGGDALRTETEWIEHFYKVSPLLTNKVGIRRSFSENKNRKPKVAA